MPRQGQDGNAPVFAHCINSTWGDHLDAQATSGLLGQFVDKVGCYAQQLLIRTVKGVIAECWDGVYDVRMRAGCTRKYRDERAKNQATQGADNLMWRAHILIIILIEGG